MVNCHIVKLVNNLSSCSNRFLVKSLIVTISAVIMIYFFPASTDGSLTIDKSFSNLAISFCSFCAASGGAAPFFSYRKQKNKQLFKRTITTLAIRQINFVVTTIHINIIKYSRTSLKGHKILLHNIQIYELSGTNSQILSIETSL